MDGKKMANEIKGAAKCWMEILMEWIEINTRPKQTDISSIRYMLRFYCSACLVFG